MSTTEFEMLGGKELYKYVDVHARYADARSTLAAYSEIKGSMSTVKGSVTKLLNLMEE